MAKDLRETHPLSRYILHTWRERPGLRGSNWDAKNLLEVHRGWPEISTSPKDEPGYLDYPGSSRDSAESGLGPVVSHHLKNVTESTSVNMGGPCGEG